MNIAVLRRRWRPYREALIARIDTRPDATRRDLIDGTCALLWRGARTGENFFETEDNLYLPAAADSQSACLNWISPLWTLVPTNSPTFTIDRGFSGDAVSQHVTWGGCSWYTGGGSQNRQDSGSIWTWETSDVNDATFAIGNVGTGTGAFIRGRNAGNCEGRASSGTTATFAQAASTGLTHVSRMSAAVQAMSRNGAQIASSGQASADATSSAICFLRNNVTYSTRRVGGGGKGAVKSTNARFDFYTAINYWITGVGA